MFSSWQYQLTSSWPGSPDWLQQPVSREVIIFTSVRIARAMKPSRLRSRPGPNKDDQVNLDGSSTSPGMISACDFICLTLLFRVSGSRGNISDNRGTLRAMSTASSFLAAAAHVTYHLLVFGQIRSPAPQMPCTAPVKGSCTCSRLASGFHLRPGMMSVPLRFPLGHK